MDFDDVLRIVGEWDRYQKWYYLMVSLPVLFKGYQVMLVIFTVFVPKHRCAVPSLLNDTYDLVSEEHRQLVLNAVPASLHHDHLVFDPCHIYADYNASLNGSIGNGSRPVESCSRWVYDRSEFDSTLISTFDLVCERKDLRAHSNMMLMAGFLVGSTVASALCDWLGRKRIYCSCLLVMMVFGVASAFPTSPEMLLAFRFMSGLGLMGVMVSGFVLAVEVIGGSRRTKLGAAWQIVWLVGPFALAGLSYFLRDWRRLQLAGSLPPFVFLLYWWLVPESPRWLVSKGRVSEAMVTIRRMAKVNRKPLPASLAGTLEECSGQARSKSSVSPLVILTHPVLALRFAIILFSWLLISMTYYGLSLNVANLSGGVRVNFIASCVVELIGYCTAVLLLDRFGRKRLHAGSMLLAGVACLLTIFTVMYAGHEYQWMTTALAMVGKLGVSSSFAIIFLYTAELHPTVLRNFGVGCGSMFARIGSMVSPYIADLAILLEGPFSTAVPLMVFGGMALAAGLTSLLLPETLNRKLPETVQDAIDFGRTAVEKETKVTMLERDWGEEETDFPLRETKVNGVTLASRNEKISQADIVEASDSDPLHAGTA